LVLVREWRYSCNATECDQKQKVKQVVKYCNLYLPVLIIIIIIIIDEKF